MHEDRARAESFGALSFGEDAEGYERTWPSYPASLLDDLMAFEPRDVLDVGCGTGRAARSARRLAV